MALFSYRINHLTAHLKNKKDFGTSLNSISHVPESVSAAKS